MTKKRGVTWKRLMRWQKRISKWWRRYGVRRLTLGLALLLLILIAGMTYNVVSRPTVHPQAYAPLLSTIAKGESNGNYNAYFGNAGNTQVDFTSMTLRQVLDWQQAYVDSGSKSSAVGKYQIIRPTLAGLVEQLELDENLVFDEKLQDQLAIALIERRGSIEYASEQLPREQFAANLAKEWAALPKVVGDKPSESYYAGDGLNEARISVDEVLTSLQPIKLQE